MAPQIRHDSRHGWPTTLRFSRRLGESLRGAEYATAIEGPQGRPLLRLRQASGFIRYLDRLAAHFFPSVKSQESS